MADFDPTLPGEVRVQPSPPAPGAAASVSGGAASMGNSTIGGEAGSTQHSIGGGPEAPRREPVALPAPGARFGRFEVMHQLGAGAMGVVMLARDVDLARPVAIKIISRRGGADDAGNLRLLREAQAVASLQHPNVVAVHEVGKVGDQIFVVMEYVDGGTLRQWCAGGTRTWQEIVEVYIQAAMGLDAAHAAGLVHRDFKPDNALIGSDGRVRVSDFGLVAGSLGEPAVLGGAVEDVTLTRTGAVLGTPAYMAPEQFAGSDVGPAADQFALCVALFEALYGTRPFAGAQIMEILVAIESGSMRAQTRADVPMPIHGAIIRGIAREPGMRHPSMRALAQALRWRPPVSAPKRPKGPIIAVAGVVATMVLVAGSAAWWMSRNDAPPAAPTPTSPPPTVAPKLEPSWACGVGATVDALWTKRAAAGLAESFAATGSPFAIDSAARTNAALDRYALALRSTGAQTCQSPPKDALVVARANACLANAIDAFGGTLEALMQAPTPGVVESAVLVASGLPTPTRCNDPEMLGADGPPPSRPLEELSPMRRKVWGTFALLQSGEIDRASKELEATRDAIASLDAGGLDVLAALMRAHIAEGRIDMVGSEGALREALAHARAASDVTLESIVLSDLVRLNVGGLARLADADAIAQQLRTLLPRVAIDTRWYGRGALAQLAQAAGRIPEADAEASAEIDGLAGLAWQRTLALAGARLRRANLRAQIGRPAEALVDAQQAIVEYEQAAGASSTTHANALTELAMIHSMRGEKSEARARLAQARVVLDKASPRAQLGLSEVLLRFADLERNAGDYEQAARLLTDAFKIAERSGDEERIARVAIELALVEFLRANFEEATAGIEIAVSIGERFPQSLQIDRMRLIYLRAGVAHAQAEFPAAIAFHTQRLAQIELRMGPVTSLAASTWIDLGELHVLTGDCTQARVELARALRIREVLKLGPDLDLARVLTAQAICSARDEEIVAARDQAREAAKLPEAVAPAVLLAPRLAMIEAEIALAEGSDSRARVHAEKARAAYAAMGTAWVSQKRDVETWMEDNLDEVEQEVSTGGGTPKH